MTSWIEVVAGRYCDSVTLMTVAARANSLPEITRAAALMATPANLDVLKEAGFETGTVKAGPSDLILAATGTNQEACVSAVSAMRAALDQSGSAPPGGSDRTESGSGAPAPRTVAGGSRHLPGANLALISVPGEHAATAALQALDQGLHLFLFSNNVSLADELLLKQTAADRRLLVMGPDCGTALIGGTALGFANEVRRGSIGLVSASGTGAQEVSTLIHKLGLGISHIIGTGGRDLSDAVGGISMQAGIRLLAEDPGTEVIILISKPPSATVAAQVRTALAQSGKPGVICFLGMNGGGPMDATTLEEAALKGVALASQVGAPRASAPSGAGAQLLEYPLGTVASRAAATLRPTQRKLRALYSGGTLCQEAVLLLEPTLGEVGRTEASAATHFHTAVDLGDDLYTRGRPHPMIDPTLRLEALARAAADPEVGVILLDVVLGYCAHPDPAGALAPAVRRAIAAAGDSGRGLVVIAAVCGTELDPQPYASQAAKLEAAGALIAPTNARAARLAAAILGRSGQLAAAAPAEGGTPR